MPYRVRWEGHGVYRRFFGIVSPQDFKDAYEEITSDVRYQGVRYIISDYLEAQWSPAATEHEVSDFAALERRKFYSDPDIVNASVATDLGILEHIRYYESLNVSPYPSGVFSTVADARKWIASNPRLGWPSAMARSTSGVAAPHA
jgi:hypothetical protein